MVTAAPREGEGSIEAARRSHRRRRRRLLPIGRRDGAHAHAETCTKRGAGGRVVGIFCVLVYALSPCPCLVEPIGAHPYLSCVVADVGALPPASRACEDEVGVRVRCDSRLLALACWAPGTPPPQPATRAQIGFSFSFPCPLHFRYTSVTVKRGRSIHQGHHGVGLRARLQFSPLYGCA